jgi:mevalonate kinase
VGIALDSIYVSLEMTSAFAPGKVILCGEHAVVYGQPALALPIHQVQAQANVTEISDEKRGHILIQAHDIQFSKWLHETDENHPLSRVVQLSLEKIQARDHPALKLEIQSSIPIASGMGSSAAISIAVIRALSTHLGSPLSSEEQSQIAFEVEKIHHGTPSGIDNTVIAYEKPVYFIQGEKPVPFEIGANFHLIIADSGIASPTSEAVAKVRQGWSKDKAYYEALFDQMGFIAHSAKRAIKAGQIHVLGSLLNHNQVLLETLGVSSPELDLLLQAARENGALGAKLSGAGVGGNIIALVTQDSSDAVMKALTEIGAVNVILSKVEA